MNDKEGGVGGKKREEGRFGKTIVPQVCFDMWAKQKTSQSSSPFSFFSLIFLLFLIVVGSRKRQIERKKGKQERKTEEKKIDYYFSSDFR